MKNLKTVLFALALITFVGGNTISAQEKAKDVRGKAQKLKIEQMKEKMENATPEERAQIEEKMRAYKKEQMNNGNAYGKNKGDLEGRDFGQDRALHSRQKVKEAYQETKQTRMLLEDSSVKIKEAHERLEVAKKEGKLSADEISVKEAKIAKAEKELKDANQALDKKQKVIMRIHDELPSDN